MAKDDADGKRRSPFIQINGVQAGFNGCDLLAAPAERSEGFARVSMMLPRHGIFCAQRGLTDGRLGRVRSDAAEIKRLDPDRVSRPKE